MGSSVRMYLYLLRGHTYDYRYFVYNYKLVLKGRIMKNVLLDEKDIWVWSIQYFTLVPRNTPAGTPAVPTGTVPVEYYMVCRFYWHQYRHTLILFWCGAEM